MENINNILGILAGVLIAGIIVVIIVMFFAIKDHLNDKNKTGVKNITSCNKCKCLIYKKDAYEVKVDYINLFDGLRYFYSYYCMNCKPNYSRKFNNLILGKESYYQEELEVTEQGEPIGYIKKK